MAGAASHGSSSQSHSHNARPKGGRSAGKKAARKTTKAARAASGGKRTQHFRSASFVDGVEQDSEQELEFQKRTLAKQEFNAIGFAGYVAFLFMFLYVATNQRDSDVYNFAQSVRATVGASSFESIGHSADYFEYLGLHFFPGLQENSIDRLDAKPFSVVGAPRIRAVRARRCDAEDNDMTDYLENVAAGMRCLIPVDASEYETESFGGQDGQFFKHWINTVGPDHPPGLDDSLHNSYGWEGGIGVKHTYPGTGYLVPADIVEQLLNAPLDVSVTGTEFYPFPHEAIDVSVLESNGWADPQTVAIFHDVTVVSANKEMYCHVRMLLEIGGNHGLLKPSVALSVLFLDDVASAKVLLETLFMCYVFMLISSEFAEFWALYAKDSSKELKEQMVEHRYRLRQRMLQYAAFQGIMVYRPQPVMKKLMHRLFVKYQDDGLLYVPSATHIENMNKIGEDMMKVHNKWRTMRETGFKPRGETGRLCYTEWDPNKKAWVPAAMKIGDARARQAAMAVIDLFDQVRTIHTLRLKQKQLDRLEGASGKFALSQIRLRFPMAVDLFFRDVWNFVDFFNYLLFSISIWFRIAALFHDIPQIQNQLEVLTAETRYSTHVDFSVFAWRDGIQNKLNAFNAILTWLKIFKYLEVYPQFKMLTSTLKKSATMLKTLVQSLFLVLIGSGQGFFMAFGVSTYSFRSFDEAILGLLRMAVGDFDYTELQGAQPVLGPLMFWVFLFLVFFVLMSMFIALIAEAFEEAKEEHAANQVKSHLSSGKLNLLSTKRLLQEAKSRRELASKTFHPDDKDGPERGMGLVSDEFIRDLQPFDSAVEVFLKEIERQDSIEKRKQLVAGKGKLRSQKQRRGSVQFRSRYAIGEAVVEGTFGTWWDHSLVGRWLRSGLYWAQIQQEDKTGNVRYVADWFDEVETKSKGVEYRATENYRARSAKELSYDAGDIIVIVKKENDAMDENGNVLKEGGWYGYRKVDGAGIDRIVRNRVTLEKLALEDFNTHEPVDAGENGALSDQEYNGENESEDDNSETDFEVHEALDTIQLGGTGPRKDCVGSSSEDDDIMHGLAMIQKNCSKEQGARRRVQTMFENPTQEARTPGSGSGKQFGPVDGTEGQKGSVPSPLPLALTSQASVAKSDSILQQLDEANRRVEKLERELRNTKKQLDERELEIEHLRIARGEHGVAIQDAGSSVYHGSVSSEDSQKIDEIHKLLSARQQFEDKVWSAKGGMARAILEDHDRTKKIETTLKSVMRKLEAMATAGGATSEMGGNALLPGAVAETRSTWSIDNGGDGGASQHGFVETPSTRLRRAEHKEEAAFEWQRRRGELQTK